MERKTLAKCPGDLYLLSGLPYYSSSISLHLFQLYQWHRLLSFVSVVLLCNMSHKMCSSSSVISNWVWFLSLGGYLAMPEDDFDGHHGGGPIDLWVIEVGCAAQHPAMHKIMWPSTPGVENA